MLLCRCNAAAPQPMQNLPGTHPPKKWDGSAENVWRVQARQRGGELCPLTLEKSTRALFGRGSSVGEIHRFSTSTGSVTASAHIFTRASTFEATAFVVRYQ